MKIKIVSFAICMLLSRDVFALQELTVKDQDKIDVTISSSDVNRIAFTNDEIKSVYGSLSLVHVEKDEDNGQIFLTPKARKTKPFTLSLISASGATVDLRVKAVKGESETLLLKLDKRGSEELTKEKKAKERIIRKIISGALRGKTLKGYRILEHEDFSLDRGEKSLIQKRSYIGSKYRILVFDYENLKSSKQTISENMFKISPNSIAVAIVKKTLEPKEKTKLVVVEKLGQQIKHCKK